MDCLLQKQSAMLAKIETEAKHIPKIENHTQKWIHLLENFQNRKERNQQPYFRLQVLPPLDQVLQALQRAAVASVNHLESTICATVIVLAIIVVIFYSSLRFMRLCLCLAAMLFAFFFILFFFLNIPSRNCHPLFLMLREISNLLILRSI